MSAAPVSEGPRFEPVSESGVPVLAVSRLDSSRLGSLRRGASRRVFTVFLAFAVAPWLASCASSSERESDRDRDRDRGRERGSAVAPAGTASEGASATASPAGSSARGGGAGGRSGAASPSSALLVARTYIRAEPSEVWRHFTEPSALSRWSTAECKVFEPRPGGAMRFSNGVRTVYEGEVLRVDEGTGLAYTFRFVGFGFDEPASHVRVDVLPRGETVFVSIRHDCTGAPRTAAMIGPVGWTKSLARLKTLLETGRPMPWPKDP